MRVNHIPYIFLLILIIILIFMGGMRYGREVEKVNKTIEYIISLTPTAAPYTPTPTMQPKLEFITHQECGVAFLYPGTMDKKTLLATAGISQVLYQDTEKDAKVRFLCYNPLAVEEEGYSTLSSEFLKATAPSAKDVSSASALLKYKQTARFKMYKLRDETLELKLIHPTTGDFVLLQYSPNMQPLMDTSLSYTLPSGK